MHEKRARRQNHEYTEAIITVMTVQYNCQCTVINKVLGILSTGTVPSGDGGLEDNSQGLCSRRSCFAVAVVYVDSKNILIF